MSDKEIFQSLLAVHKEDSSILISNGFLNRIRDDHELVDSLNEDEKAFLDLSIKTFEDEAMLAIAANGINCG